MQFFSIPSSMTLRIDQIHFVIAESAEMAIEAWHQDKAQLISWSTGDLIGDIELGEPVGVPEALTPPVDPRDEFIAMIARMNRSDELVEGTTDDDSEMLDILIRRARALPAQSTPASDDRDQRIEDLRNALETALERWESWATSGPEGMTDDEEGEFDSLHAICHERDE